MFSATFRFGPTASRFRNFGHQRRAYGCIIDHILMNSRQAIAFLNLFSLSSLKTGSLSRSECNQINNVRVSTEFFDSQPQPRISRTVNLLHCDNPASSQNQCRHTEIRAPKKSEPAEPFQPPRAEKLGLPIAFIALLAVLHQYNEMYL